MRRKKYTIISALLGLAMLIVGGCSTTPQQERFATPEDAARELQQALITNDQKRLEEIFGRDALEEAASGDPISDRNDREVIGLAMEQSWRWAPKGEQGKELIVGEEQWPFPAPLVRVGNEWQFDAQSGKEEMLARRIGRNELGIIGICRTYVWMQLNYASSPHDDRPAGRFAQRLQSTPGRRDGLYWEAKRGEPRSPMGDLVAHAESEGYSRENTSAPFWGYRFRILSAQGPAASGGRRSYIDRGEMTGGFALIAFPAKYGSSGVMTFMVGKDGVVFEKDLGDKTESVVERISEYNPDETWNPVAER